MHTSYTQFVLLLMWRCFAGLLFLLLHVSEGLNVQYLTGDSFDVPLETDTFLHLTFSPSCDRNCRGTFSFVAPKGKAFLRVLSDPRQGAKLTVSVEHATSRSETGTLVDPYVLQAYSLVESVEEDNAVEKVIVVNVLATSLGARFALLTVNASDPAQSPVYNFAQLTVGFPILVGSRRQWAESFYFPYVYGALILFYFLAWPLRKRRPNTQTILTSLAALSLLAWLVDSFYLYFLLLEVSSEQRFVSFLLHVFANAIFLFLLFYTQNLHRNSRRWACISVAFLSFFVGGAGCYVCPTLLCFELYFLENNARRKESALVCKSS